MKFSKSKRFQPQFITNAGLYGQLLTDVSLTKTKFNQISPGIEKSNYKDGLDLRIKKDPKCAAIDSEVKIKKIISRKNPGSGGHQELMVQTHKNVYIRLSRNNAEDTFQYGASREHNESTYTQVTEMDPIPGLTVGVLLEKVRIVRKNIPQYHHGDCAAFAMKISNQIAQDSPFLQEEEEDDFMKW